MRLRRRWTRRAASLRGDYDREEGDDSISQGKTIRRALFQRHMERHGVDTRMVWTGNVTRQPAFKEKAYRADPQGVPNAHRVMQCGLILPCTHACSDDDMAYICEQIDAFFKQE